MRLAPLAVLAPRALRALRARVALRCSAHCDRRCGWVRPRVRLLAMPEPLPRPLVAIIVVGLTPRLLAHAPRIRRLADEGFMARLTPPLPAVTCTSQATMITGLPPRGHGVVGNGWYFRELAE